MCHSEGGLYICLPPKPSGPNWLEKDFIVYPTYSLGSVRGSTGPGHMGIMTHSEGAHLYAEFNKLVY
jgi:hypothetical protein